MIDRKDRRQRERLKAQASGAKGIGCIVIGFIVVLVLTLVVPGWEQVPSWKWWILGGAVLLLILFLWALSEMRKRVRSQIEPFVKGLRQYLDNKYPIPEYSRSLQDQDWDEIRSNAYANRFRAAVAWLERSLGHPLTDDERGEVQRILGYAEEDYAPGSLDEEGEFVPLKPEPVDLRLQEKITTIEAEFEQHLPDHAAFFTPEQKQVLAGMFYKERIKEYIAIKEVLRQEQSIEAPSEPAVEPPLSSPSSVETKGEPVPEDVAKMLQQIETAKTFDEALEFQKAKITVENEHDPQRRNQLLRVLYNVALRIRKDRDW